MFVIPKHLYFCRWVSLVRPAPTELPQDGNVARVCGCSGAMQVAYPFFYFFFFPIVNTRAILNPK